MLNVMEGFDYATGVMAGRALAHIVGELKPGTRDGVASVVRNDRDELEILRHRDGQAAYDHCASRDGVASAVWRWHPPEDKALDPAHSFNLYILGKPRGHLERIAEVEAIVRIGPSARRARPSSSTSTCATNTRARFSKASPKAASPTMARFAAR